MAMALKFSSDTSAYQGGGCYVTGKVYALSREEACLWIRRGVVDLASLCPVDLTDAVLAENAANLLPGDRLTLGETIAALAATARPA
jgi:hypothetical protein